jgi:hypothetical protein
MKIKTIIFCLFSSCIVFSCSTHERTIQQVQVMPIIRIENTEWDEWLSLLLSPHYFEHTQAARAFLNVSPDEAIVYLYQHKNKLRETNNTMQPVCLQLIKLIFQKQETEWSKKQQSHKIKGIAEIARKEMERRILKK